MVASSDLLGTSPLEISTFCFNVGAFQRFPSMVKKLRMAGTTAEYGAVTQCDQDLGAFAHHLATSSLYCIVDSAFQNAGRPRHRHQDVSDR
jgi:hypothetical protein